MALQEMSQALMEEYMAEWQSFSLTEEEINSPVWQQIFHKRVMDRRSVKVCDQEEETDDLWNYTFETDFSDCDEELEAKKENKDLLNKDERHLKLRDYQKELVTKAFNQNAVICAPTGSGKTRVATQIILEHLQQPALKKKKVAFLATTVPLTVQQYQALLKYLPKEHKITTLTGQNKNSMSLESLLEYNDIFVMTPMILVNNLKHFDIKLDVFTMMVFDECHHTRKDEPYNLLMSSYLKDKAQGLDMPQILGLSATIGIEDSLEVDEAKEVILDFLGNLDAHCLVTVQDHIDELNALVPKPIEKYQTIVELPPDKTYLQIIKTMNNLEEQVKVFVRKLNDDDANKLLSSIPPNKKLQAYGQWAVQLKDAVQKVPNNNLGKDDHENLLLSSIGLEYLFRYNAALEIYDLVEPIDILKYLEHNFRKFYGHVDRTVDEIQFYSYFEDLKELILNSGEIRNPNLKTLGEVLTQNLIRKETESRGIIFVKTRALAEAVKSWLLRCEDQELQNLNAEIFTGANVSEDLGGMTQSKQEDIKEKFKTGDIKVLVATSVAEEGLDIPNCNLIIKYNQVGNEVTAVQTKGRSRKFGGISVLLAMDEVLIREIKNREKTLIMEQAIQAVSKMNRKDIIASVLKYQENFLKSQALAEKHEAQRKMYPQIAKFRVVCRKCRQVGVDSFNMRTILGKYRVSIDRELLNRKFIICRARDPEFMDDLEFIGPVFCCGPLPSGKVCGSQLGIMIKHKKVPFFNVGIKFVGFSTDDSKPLLLCKQWKKMPYDIEELSFEDIKSYIEAM